MRSIQLIKAVDSAIRYWHWSWLVVGLVVFAGLQILTFPILVWFNIEGLSLALSLTAFIWVIILVDVKGIWEGLEKKNAKRKIEDERTNPRAILERAAEEAATQAEESDAS